MEIKTRDDANRIISEIYDGLYESGGLAETSSGSMKYVKGGTFSFTYAAGYSDNNYAVGVSSEWPSDKIRALNAIGVSPSEYDVLCSKSSFIFAEGISFYHARHPDLAKVSDEKLFLAAKIMSWQWGGYIGRTSADRQRHMDDGRGSFSNSRLLTYGEEQLKSYYAFNRGRNKGWW